MCRPNMGRVTTNLIIFTSLGCVISHHIGPYHPSEECRTGPGVPLITRTRTVATRKQAGCRSGRKMGGLYPFGMVGALSDSTGWARSRFWPTRSGKGCNTNGGFTLL